jgi:radical SAM superfamily enzyme YgiQ (UPF0313 family)
MPILSVLIPYPGTALTNKLEAENRLLHKDWSKYMGLNVVFLPKLLGKHQLETEAFSTYKKIYTFKFILIRSLYQPLGNIIRTFFPNVVMRKVVHKIQ